MKITDYSRGGLRQALKAAEPTLFDDAVKFLLADSREFGSGYAKQLIWKYITRYPLNAWDIERLQSVALEYLERPMTPEFKPMSFTMALIATPKFWEIVRAKLDDENPKVRLNSSCLYPYSEGIAAGEKKRREATKEKLRWAAAHREELLASILRVHQLLATLHQKENWQGGKITRKPLDPQDLPILYHHRDMYDGEIATLDWRFCVLDVLIPKLDAALNMGRLHGGNRDARLYIVFILGKLGDARAAPILRRFLEDTVDHKFSSTLKRAITASVLKALRKLGTPEALTVLKRREDELNSVEWNPKDSDE